MYLVALQSPNKSGILGHNGCPRVRPSDRCILSRFLQVITSLYFVMSRSWAPLSVLPGPRTSISFEISGETGMTRLESSRKVGLVYDLSHHFDWSLLGHTA